MSDLETDLLRVLAVRLRVMAIAQLARFYWGNTTRPLRNAQESVAKLVRQDWLVGAELLARPVSELFGPVAVWTPGHPAPDFEAVAAGLHQRARGDAVQTPVVTASARARACFGSGGQPPRLTLTQLTHDLHVAEVFFRLRRGGLEPRRWIGEDEGPAEWSLAARPDALLLDEGGRWLQGVEYGGDYPPERLLRLHAALASIHLAYEVW